MTENKTKIIQVKIDATILTYMRLEAQIQNKKLDTLIEDMFKKNFKEKFDI